jgi:hypothetical protein
MLHYSGCELPGFFHERGNALVLADHMNSGAHLDYVPPAHPARPVARACRENGQDMEEMVFFCTPIWFSDSG